MLPTEPIRDAVTRRSFAAAVTLTAAFVVALILESRPWICKSGPGLWTGAWTHCTSQHFLDPYSFTHVLHGVILYWALRIVFPRMPVAWRMVLALAIEVAWELLENSPWVIERYRQQTASLDYTGDSILNSIGDLATMGVGFLLAARFSWKVALAAFILVELALLITIRDNLTLNVLMLFIPSDAIKQWQLGH